MISVEEDKVEKDVWYVNNVARDALSFKEPFSIIKLKENDEAQGTKGYEENKEEIENQKKRAAQEDSGKYRQEVAIPAIEKSMAKNEVNENELDDNTKSDWERLKNGEVSQPEEIIEKEKNVLQKVGELGAEKKIIDLINKVKVALKSNNKEEIEKVKREIMEFIEADSIYYSTRKSDAQKLLADLNNSTQQTDSPDKFPWKVVIPLFLLVGVVLAITALVIIRNRRRKQAKVE